jgi:hypothetical protein
VISLAAFEFQLGEKNSFAVRRERLLPMMKFTPVLLPVRRPLLSASACAALIDQPVPKIGLLVEEGRLRMAFNVTHDLASCSRCLRITTLSVKEYLADPTQLRTEAPGALAKEVDQLFPPICAAYRSPEVARALNCSVEHVKKLVRAGCLTEFRAGRACRGGAALITRKSCAEFLLQRRIA